jgi:hypothetical protein
MRAVVLTFEEGEQRWLPFHCPWAAEVYLHLIPQMQVDGNEEVTAVRSARLDWLERKSV